MVPPYGTSVSNIDYSTTGPTFEITRRGGMSYDDGTSPGGRPEIAPYPDWAVRYLVHKNPTARDFTLKTADLFASAYQGFLRGADQGIIRLDSRPHYWPDGRSYAGDKPVGDMDTVAPARIDNAHMPSIAYIPYLITGDRFYLDALKNLAAGAIMVWPDSVPYPRGGADGIMAVEQVRGFAWSLRNLADAAVSTPDDDPDKAYLTSKLFNNLNWLDSYARTYQSPLGTLWPDKRDNYAVIRKIAPWEHYYLAWAVDHCQELGFNAGTAYRDRVARFALSLFSNEANGYPRAYGAPYELAFGRIEADRLVYFQT
ncbi:MAG: hypothetical protein IMZ62_15210, partial [Chloroflexi bacterium]|nr:hypothetical protein [Chloroflexota bacterium]